MNLDIAGKEEVPANVSQVVNPLCFDYFSPDMGATECDGVGPVDQQHRQTRKGVRRTSQRPLNDNGGNTRKRPLDKRCIRLGPNEA